MKLKLIFISMLSILLISLLLMYNINFQNEMKNDFIGYSEVSFSSEMEIFEIKKIDRIESEIIEYTLRASESKKYFFGNEQTDVYSYNNLIPGPILRGKVGDTFKITLINDLDENTTIHWHGIQLNNSQDGVPHITQDPVSPNTSFTYEFQLSNSGVYWYHPHVNTPKQLEMGLYGIIIVDDNEEISYDKDLIIALDDVLLMENSQIYPIIEGQGAMHGRFGNSLLLNGKINPKFNVKEGEIVRLRILNTANARTFNFGIKGLELLVIGEDIGLVEKPYVTDYLTISAGQRFDVLIYLNNNESNYQMINYNSRGYDSLGSLEVKGKISNSTNHNFYSSLKTSNLNLDFPNWSEMENSEPNITLELKGVNDGTGLKWMINDKTFPEDPETLELEEGKFYKIRYINAQGQIHPMHMHGQKFMILSRNGVEEENKAYRDTVLIRNREVVDIGLIAEGKGKWVNHCHILEHAEAGMLSILNIK